MTSSIIVHHDPEGINKRVVHNADNENLLDWLIDEYGENGFTVPTCIFLGDVNEKNVISSYREINIILKDQIVNIVHRPQGANFIYAVVVAVIAAVVLAPDINPSPAPENPNFAKTNESPNNRLTGQTNLARPLARIPDIYGRLRVYPDLGAKTVTEYISHVKFVTEYLIFGRGEFLVEDIKSGETLISNISGSEATIYNPGDLIPELLNVTDSNEVNGQEVVAPNDDSNFSTIASGVLFESVGSKFSGSSPGLAAFESMPVGDQFVIAGSSSNNGTFTLVSFSKSGGPTAPPDYINEYEYEIVVQELITDELSLVSVSFDAPGASDKDIVGPFEVDGDTEEVWFDIVAPRGLANRQGGSTLTVTVSFYLILDEIDSQGSIINTEKTFVSISDNTLDSRFYTFKVFPANPGSRYQATVQRLSDTVNDSNYYDQTKWSRLSGVSTLLNFDQGNVTSVVLRTQATEQAVKTQERKFNAVVTRKLRSYTTSGGAITPTLEPTTKFADAVLEHMTNEKIGNKPLSDIDLDGLYTIQESLDNVANYGSVLGRFSYSFSGEKSSVKDEILTIANAVRVFVRKIGNGLEFGRDEVRANRVTMFNTRNKKPNSEKKAIKLHKPNDFDGVELQWVYETTGEAFTINLPDTGETNPKKIEAAGIRNFRQAWNRASIEFSKLKLRRETVTFDATKEGLFAVTGDRVANADGTDVEAQSGEIKAISGFDVETYTSVDFKSQANASVILRNESGGVDSEILVTPRLDGVNGFILDALPSFTIRVRDDLTYQNGTFYTLALTGETKIKDYIIQKNTPKDSNYVTMELTNYNPSIYAADSEQPPTHETTITKVVLDVVPSGNIVESIGVALSQASAETLAWNLAPSGTYSASSAAEEAFQSFTASIDGEWAIVGGGQGTPGSGSGDYRPKVVGDDPDNYEIRITSNRTGGSGVIAATGNVVFGSWVPHSESDGIIVTDSTSGTTTVDITVEIREIATPANTTGVASFEFSADGVPPI